jgi:hypothetical protein
VENWEIIADRLSATGWSLGCVSALDSERRTMWIVDAHRDGKRFVVRADEKLTAFLKLESGKEGASGWLQQRGQMTRARSRSSRKLCACVTSRNSSGVR